MAFIGLWLYADREGRMRDEVEKLKALIFPFDRVDMNKILNDLDKKFITRYSISNKKYIQINNFKVHQRPHHTEKDSELPPLQIATYDNKQDGSGDTEATPCLNGDTRVGKEGKGKEGNGNGQPSVDREKEIEYLFNTIWSKYPRKRGRAPAYRHFKKTVTSVDSWKDINIALTTYLESKEVADGYIKYGSTWFNEWRDWLEPDP